MAGEKKERSDGIERATDIDGFSIIDENGFFKAIHTHEGGFRASPADVRAGVLQSTNDYGAQIPSKKKIGFWKRLFSLDSGCQDFRKN